MKGNYANINSACAFMCVGRHVYVYMCMHVHECTRRLEVSSSHSPLLFSALFCEKGWSLSLPIFLEIYMPHLSSARITGVCSHVRIFTWMLRISAQVFMFVWQGFYLLSHFPSPPPPIVNFPISNQDCQIKTLYKISPVNSIERVSLR